MYELTDSHKVGDHTVGRLKKVTRPQIEAKAPETKDVSLLWSYYYYFTLDDRPT